MKSHGSCADAVDELGRQRTADHCAWRETKELCYFSSKHNRKDAGNIIY
jgi:hypothetical protein